MMTMGRWRWSDISVVIAGLALLFHGPIVRFMASCFSLFVEGRCSQVILSLPKPIIEATAPFVALPVLLTMFWQYIWTAVLIAMVFTSIVLRLIAHRRQAGKGMI